MAEYSKEKLYFIKLPSDFFQGHRMRILESIPSGKEYELIYLKLICESVSHNGYLRFSKDTPYTPEMIAAITGATVNEVNGALVILEKLELIQRTDNDSLFIPDVPKMTGSTTEGAEKKKMQRSGQKGGQMSPSCPPRELESKSTRELDRNKNSMGTPNVVHQESSSLIKPDITGLKQKALCEMLVEAGYVREEDLQDPQWDDFLDECVREHKYVNTKIKLEYFIARTCHMRKVGEDECGNGIVRREFRYESEPIQKRFCYMVAAMQEAFDRMDGGDEDGQ